MAVPASVLGAQTVWSLGQKATEDPIEFIIRGLRTIGLGLIGGGVLMGVGGYYLKSASITGSTAVSSTLSTIAGFWANIKAPTFTPAATGTAPVLGPNPLQDLQNFGADAWTDVQAAGQDLAQIGGAIGTLGEDVAAGIVDLAKSIFSIGTNAPSILWNGAVAVIGGGIADVLNWAFPYLIIFGAIALGTSIGLYAIRAAVRWYYGEVIRPVLAETVADWKERAQNRLRVFRDYLHPRALSTPAQTSHENPPLEGLTPETPAPQGIREFIDEVAPPIPPVPAEAAGPGDKAPPPPAEPPAPPPNPDPPIPEGWKQEEVEDYLGAAETARRDAARAQAA